MSAIYVHGRTDVGRVRDINEDALHIESLHDGGRLLVVCDGLGGHGGGDVASKLATDVIAARVREASGEDPRHVLFEALQQADTAVAEAAAGGGSTVVVAWIHRREAWVAWMGDSRLAHLRNDALIDQTRDHTRVADLIDAGQLSETEAEHHADRHVVTRALGGGEGNPDVWDEPVPLKDGDALLLFSDGLHDLVPADEMVRWVSGVDYRDAVESLVNLANERGGTDNITVVCAVMGTPRIGGTALSYDDRKTAEPPVGRQTLAVDPGHRVPVAEPASPSPQPVRATSTESTPSGTRPWAVGLPLVIVAVFLALLIGMVGGFVGRGLITPDRAAADLPTALP